MLCLFVASVAALSAAPTQSRVAWNQFLRKLDKDSFDQVYEWEAWLEAEAGSTLYAKAVRRLSHKSKSLGIPLREGFLANAKATAKQRAQKADYDAAKEEARVAKIAECQDALVAIAESEDLEAVNAALTAAVEAGVPDDFEGLVTATALKQKLDEAARLAAIEAAQEGLVAVAESDDLDAVEAALTAATDAGVPDGFDGWAPARAAKAKILEAVAKLEDAKEGLLAVAESDDMEAIDAALAAATDAGVPDDFEGLATVTALKAKLLEGGGGEEEEAPPSDEGEEADAA